ncbi:DUF1211 domain-containing protein [Microbacterium sp. 4R-513]|uniref:TMEM175 family protein n=1 Tax=Microbacterium sp. 4R-513 TaxID=2567934 RepID=UPI0013E1511D|nr:TMEM175 family protein [Microbacterium sp. 4R-513]QIG38508.1 DUF1211 domain-containing protein [Microbacterium sp. 4R-513]
MADGRGARTYATTRVEAYTDGVFAIAATLLVLDLTTKGFGRLKTDDQMWASLVDMSDNFVAFAVSFLLLSMLWTIHLQQWRDIGRVDSPMLWLNNLRLLFIVLIPFTTSLVSEYSEFYAGRMLLPINFFFAALLGYLSYAWAAARGGHLLEEDARDNARRQSLGGLSAVIFALVAVVLAPWVGSWAFLVFVLNEPFTRFLQRRGGAREGAGA